MYLVQLPLPTVSPLIIMFPGQVLNYIVVYSTALKVELYIYTLCSCSYHLRSHLYTLGFLARC